MFNVIINDIEKVSYIDILLVYTVLLCMTLILIKTDK